MRSAILHHGPCRPKGPFSSSFVMSLATMCDVALTPRSVCVRMAPGNVNMVANGKINTRLSPEWQQARFLGDTLPGACHPHSGAMEIGQQWLCFSPMTKKPSCQSCWLLGDPSAMQNEWANGSLTSGRPKNFGVDITSILHDVL